LPAIENRVEVEFLRPTLLGESILPYRVFQPFEAVIPVDSNGVALDAETATLRGLDGLHGWMRKCERMWTEYSETAERISLVGQFDYYGKLSSQFPVASLRVVYAKAGTLPAACLLRDDDAIIDHKLYWAPVPSEAEARYLSAVLNSETARSRIEKMQSRGQWGARDFDKVMFNLPIPRFDPKSRLHAELAKAAQRAESIAAAVALPEKIGFQRARKMVREALAEAGVAQDIDRLVAQLLDGD
jgi:hypothetical protein